MLVDALYGGKTEQFIETAGEVRGRPQRQRVGDAEDRRREDLPGREEGRLTMAARKIGDVILDVKNISLRFGGVKALTDISFDVREHEVRAIIGPNGAGKSSMLNCINGVYQPQEGSITFRGKTFTHMNSRQVAEMGVARTFQNLALFKGMSVLDNIMTGRNLKMKSNLFQQAHPLGRGRARGDRAPRVRRDASSTSSRSRPTARRRSAACPTACRSASTSAARWRWSRRCCCSTSRWPA